MAILLSLFERVPRSWIHAFSNMCGGSPRLKAMTDWLPHGVRNRDGTMVLGEARRFDDGNSAVGADDLASDNTAFS